jgi:hypothetical protein
MKKSRNAVYKKNLFKKRSKLYDIFILYTAFLHPEYRAKGAFHLASFAEKQYNNMNFALFPKRRSPACRMPLSEFKNGERFHTPRRSTP